IHALQVNPKQDLIPNLTDLCYTVYTFSCLSSCFVVIIIIKHEMENEQLLSGIARFFICEKLVFAQPQSICVFLFTG
ncbi:hypothetical protein, partial [Streptococcus suis]|uniref:hypothetical protein n=1 Tax=Streptococcus suis TaxID=1307 RepID=UPI001EDE1E68